MERDSRIFVAGHRGLVGAAIVRRLERDDYRGLLLRTRQELDLTDQSAVRAFFDEERPEYVFLAAARVGGIVANASQPVDFLYENLMIEANVLRSALDYGTEKLLFLGSSCIYPKHAIQPIPESSLLTGPLEPTSEAYAIAKIAGLKLCEAINREKNRRFISAMPTNLYGPADNFHPEDSHVVAGLMRRFHESKKRGDASVVVWGSGTPRRELLHVDDLADALLLLIKEYEAAETINVGSGDEITIRDLAVMIRDLVGFQGGIELDPTRPDGTPRKLLDSSRLMKLGWKPSIPLEEGLRSTYQWALHEGVLE